MAMSGGAFDLFSSARAMLAALHYRKISAVELLELHLERIARYNPALNAIVKRRVIARNALQMQFE